jgi:D-alanine-D-alanine ligase
MSTSHRFAGRRVAVVMGGLSAEREVSLDTGAGVSAALKERGWDVVAIDWRPGDSLARLLEQSGAEVVWNALHGTWGEDGAVQGLCACLELPCTGSGILASALAMDKVMSKRIFESNGLPTPRWRILPHAPSPGTEHGDELAAETERSPEDRAKPETPDERSEGSAERDERGDRMKYGLLAWPLPFVVKPANEGSSVGVSIVDTRDQLPAALAAARQFHGPVIVEDYIAGTEVFVGILNDRVLGSVEVRPKTRFYDYEAKYKRTDTQYLIPPELPAKLIERAQELALAAYRALGCTGHARPDLRISTAGEVFVLEVNTLPGMTKTSLLPKIAASIGMDYPTLCEHILETASTI